MVKLTIKLKILGFHIFFDLISQIMVTNGQRPFVDNPGYTGLVTNTNFKFKLDFKVLWTLKSLKYFSLVDYSKY